LVDGTSYLTSGDLIRITTASNGSIEIDVRRRGFANQSDSVISMSNSTQTLTISPTPGSSSFSFISNDVEYVMTGAVAFQFSSSSSTTRIYFNNLGQLTSSATFFEDLILRNAWVAEIHWDVTNQYPNLFADERHTQKIEPDDHLRRHRTFGALLDNRNTSSRFGLTMGAAFPHNGSSNTHAQFELTSGQFYDEDLFLNSTDTTQQLQGIARIPLLYRAGTDWNTKLADDFCCMHTGALGPAVGGTTQLIWTHGSGRLAYNSITGGSGSLVEVGSNSDFVLTHVFATNDVRHRVMAVLGQFEYTTAAAARDGARSELLSINTLGLPNVEFVWLYSIIFQTAVGFTNVVNAVIEPVNDDGTGDAIDWRDSLPGGTSAAAGAPTTATYLVLSADANLSNERVLTIDGGLASTDAGAGGSFTVAVDGTVARVSGTHFTGNISIAGTGSFAQGISGSLTRLTSGLSYLNADGGISITTASNGQVTVSVSSDVVTEPIQSLIFTGQISAPTGPASGSTFHHLYADDLGIFHVQPDTLSGTEYPMWVHPGWGMGELYPALSNATSMDGTGLFSDAVFIDTTSTTSVTVEGASFNSTTAASSGSIAMVQCSASGMVSNLGRPIFYSKFAISTHANSTIFWGLTNATGSILSADDPSCQYIGLQYSTNRGDTTWKFVTRVTGQSIFDTGLVGSNATANSFLLERIAGTTVRLSVYNQVHRLIATQTMTGSQVPTGISPDDNLFWVLGIKSLSAAARTINNYRHLWMYRGRGV
jgi:hypothetical protein